jgi:hypothetical protein
MVVPETRRQELLIVKKKPTSQKWYQQHKQELSEKRKRRYAEDSEHRQRAIESSRRSRRGERISTVLLPPDAPISLAQAAKRLGVGVSTLHEWRSSSISRSRSGTKALSGSPKIKS